MKPILEYLFSKKSDLDKLSKTNRFHITEKDLIGDLEGFPVGVLVRMLKEAEIQGNKPDVKVFQSHKRRDKERGGFDWDKTECGRLFWEDVINYGKFNVFYGKYPEYKRYDL